MAKLAISGYPISMLTAEPLEKRWILGNGSYPNGADAFGVDHLIPQADDVDDAFVCDYGKLIYSCNRCNSAKRKSEIADPCDDPFGKHLRIKANGEVETLTKRGRYIVRVFNLNYAKAKKYRQSKIRALTRWKNTGDTTSINEFLAYPDDLPNLKVLKCENWKPSGIAESYYERDRRRELPPTY